MRLSLVVCVQFICIAVKLYKEQHIEMNGQTRPLASSDMNSQSIMPWEKLLHPSGYGAEEYAIVCLIFFIIFVALKHLIFHTLYFWWYGSARFYLPSTFRNFLTGKSFPQRLYGFVKSKSQNQESIASVLQRIECYTKEKEFALTLGKEKGEILDKAVNDRKPKNVLVCGSLYGCAVLRILGSSKATRIYLIEPDPEKASLTKKLCSLVDCDDQVIVLAGDVEVSIPKLKENYGLEKLDFVFLTSTELGNPYYDKAVKCLETCNLLYGKDVGEGQQTVLLADKVVHFGECEFLKHVRYSEHYETEYHQISLENSPDDIVDGMERATYLGP